MNVALRYVAILKRGELMPTNETKDKEQLLNLMQDISERCYCAGWMTGLEIYLWGVVEGRAGLNYGQSWITENEVSELKRLSKLANGWWKWEDNAEVFIPLKIWKSSHNPTQKTEGK